MTELNTKKKSSENTTNKISQIDYQSLAKWNLHGKSWVISSLYDWSRKPRYSVSDYFIKLE